MANVIDEDIILRQIHEQVEPATEEMRKAFNLAVERYDLKADLAERTGLEISKVEVGHIDYLRDVAFVKVYYKPIDGEVNTIDTITKLKDFE